jgi:type III secretion protein V
MLPVVTPVAVEVGTDLIYEGPEEDWQVFKTYLSQMRDKIKDQTGVGVPGVRIRANETDLPGTTYVIMLDEVPIVSGKIEKDMRYCPAIPADLSALGIPTSEIVEVINPLTGNNGCWIGRDYWDLLADKKFDLWPDPILYMVNHLEAVIRRNLDMFFGIQEVENLLEYWEEIPEAASLIKAALPDSASRFQFARALRQLVKDRVPINHWEEILKAIEDLELATKDISELVYSMRLKLKEYLPGNSPKMNRIELTQQIEDQIAKWIHNVDDKKFFAIPPEETQDLLSEIRELVTWVNKHSVLVAQNTELRPYIRRLVELEFPDLMVISNEELLPQKGC